MSSCTHATMDAAPRRRLLIGPDFATERRADARLFPSDSEPCKWREGEPFRVCTPSQLKPGVIDRRAAERGRVGVEETRPGESDPRKADFLAERSESPDALTFEPCVRCDFAQFSQSTFSAASTHATAWLRERKHSLSSSAFNERRARPLPSGKQFSRGKWSAARKESLRRALERTCEAN